MTSRNYISVDMLILAHYSRDFSLEIPWPHVLGKGIVVIEKWWRTAVHLMVDQGVETGIWETCRVK